MWLGYFLLAFFLFLFVPSYVACVVTWSTTSTFAFNFKTLILPWLSVNLISSGAMMMMNCFCRMADRRKTFSLISSRDHCQRSTPSRISDTLRAGYEPAQNLSSGLVEWNWAVVITTAPRRRSSISSLLSLCTASNYMNAWSIEASLSMSKCFFWLLFIFQLFIYKPFTITLRPTRLMD